MPCCAPAAVQHDDDDVVVVAAVERAYHLGQAHRLVVCGQQLQAAVDLLTMAREVKYEHLGSRIILNGCLELCQAVLHGLVVSVVQGRDLKTQPVQFFGHGLRILSKHRIHSILCICVVSNASKKQATLDFNAKKSLLGPACSSCSCTYVQDRTTVTHKCTLDLIKALLDSIMAMHHLQGGLLEDSRPGSCTLILQSPAHA